MQVEQRAIRTGSGAPDELLDALLEAERRLASTPRASTVRGGVTQWAEVVAASQRVMNLAAAVQDEAIASLAAVEPEELEDGTVLQTHRAAGHISLDAPAIVSGVLSVSPVHAERRVRAAVRMVADGPSGTDTETGLSGLHDAMRGGRLDGYRAGVVADELELAPPQVAAAVVAALGEHLVGDAAPRLRQRCRTVLSRVSPDLVRQRATRAREGCGLRRWAEEPGVDKWEGTFPSEDAARAWAAIDARAQQLVAEGTCQRIERARSQALIDLVTGSATIETIVTLTVPAPSDVPGFAPEVAALPTVPAGGRSTVPPLTRWARPVELTDDEDGEDAATGTSALPDQPSGESAAPCGSPDDLVEVAMGGRGERVLVTRAFLDVVAHGEGSQVAERACHRGSGALLDATTTGAYRPRAALTALVRQRDGRCRFPACQVSARFCDLDHVRPWPAGPTSAANLICLCRRHHRVKQRLGWRVRLHPDARLTWTDPTGRTRITDPVDALSALVLEAPAATFGPGDTAAAGSGARHTVDRCPADERTGAGAAAGRPTADPRDAGRPTADPNDAGRFVAGRFSLTEFALEHVLAGLTRADHEHRAALHRIALRSDEGHGHLGSGRRLQVDLHRPQAHRFGADRLVLAESRDDPSTHRRSRRRGAGPGLHTGDPPF